MWWWWFSLQVASDSCDPRNCSPPGSSVHGILQARIMEWAAISFSRRSSGRGWWLLLPSTHHYASCFQAQNPLNYLWFQHIFSITWDSQDMPWLLPKEATWWKYLNQSFWALLSLLKSQVFWLSSTRLGQIINPFILLPPMQVEKMWINSVSSLEGCYLRWHV